MTSVRKALLIARWEFKTAVMRRAYLIAVVALPLLFGGIGAVSAFTTRAAAVGAVGTPIALVDRAGLVDLPFAESQAAHREEFRTAAAQSSAIGAAIAAIPLPSIAPYANVESAIADLTARKVSAVYVVEADYLATGRLTAYSRDIGIFGQPAANQRANQIGDAIRASLLKNGLSGDELARAYAPAVAINRVSIDSSGKVSDASDASGFGRFAGSFGVFMLLTMSIFFSAGFLQQATIEDRQNRVFEVLLSSADANELLAGKILGLGGAGLLQVAIYVVLLIIPSATVLAVVEVSLGRLALSLVYCALGYLLFSSFMILTGMIGRTPQESAQMSAFWTMAAISPMFFVVSIAAAPNGWLARGLSFFPLSGPVTMLLRLSASEVPIVDIVASLLIGVVSVSLSLRATARIFRAATLMYGKRPNLPELIRWLKEAG